MWFLNKRLNNRQLEFFGGLDPNDELIILSSGSSATGHNSFSNLVGTGSNRHVLCLDAVISLFSSSCPIVVKHCNFSFFFT